MVRLVDLEVQGSRFKTRQGFNFLHRFFIFFIVYSVTVTRLDDIKYKKKD